MELKDLFQKKRKIVEEDYQETEKTEKFILKQLESINEEEFGDNYDTPDYWKVEVFENEFTIYYEFGNIDFKDILQLSEIFKKQGFELYCITDAFTRKNIEKGLFFLFRRIDDDAP